MKKLIMAVVAVSFIWAGAAFAAADAGNVAGEVTKVEGEMVTVKLADGTSKTVHVDPKGTKKEGEIKVGAHVTADVTKEGHANWIKETKAAGGMKKDEPMGTMKK
ncbi:MAG: hypothetical protein HY207_05045 [Nitrospirae bacterium]|nr:hypothetical protein [Nitrospirota bacterium]